MQSSVADICFDVEGLEYEAQVEFNFYPGDPGKLFGPPETCYPPEPEELELTKLTVWLPISKVDMDFTSMLEDEDFHDQVEALVYEWMENQAEADACAKAEAYDEAREARLASYW